MDPEKVWDQRLKIKTTGRDDVRADEYRYPYEPTPYVVLQRLADSGLLGQQDCLVDYGCGKGRVEFFLADRTRTRTIGIEYDERIFYDAQENQKSARYRGRAEFVLARAESYEVPPEVNRCYFFNPFSVEILHKVMARILESYYAAPRQIFLFFYYPSDAYVAYLMGVEEVDFYDEISCKDLFAGKEQRERILIFSLP